MIIECKVCNNKIDVIGEQSFFRLHLKKCHNIKSKQYYDLYFKKENEGKCFNCGKPTKYISFNGGYSRYCSYKCAGDSIETKNKIKNTKKLVYNDENYNNRIKAKKTCLKIYGVSNVSKNNDIKNKKVKTCLKNYGVKNYTITKEFRERVKKTCIKKYGVDNPSKCEKFKEKRSKTIFDRYGVYHYSTSREYRLLKEKLNEWIPLEQKTKFELYSRDVWKKTRKYRNKLFSKWNGNCYYTGIELNKNQNYNNETYPTIDHKKSVFFGFKNNISSEEIGNIDNLCICSRWSNKKKQIMNEETFIEYLKENNFFNKK